MPDCLVDFYSCPFCFECSLIVVRGFLGGSGDGGGGEIHLVPFFHGCGDGKHFSN